jgi:hypothetical protein
VEKQESQLFFAKSQVAQLKIKLKSTGEKLKELSRRGSMKAIGLQLEKAATEGKLAEESFMHDFISTFARNLHVQKQGKRFKPSQRELYEVLLYLGGPRLVKFHAANFGGPDLHTVFKWRQENHLNISGMPTPALFQVLKMGYGECDQNRAGACGII